MKWFLSYMMVVCSGLELRASASSLFQNKLHGDSIIDTAKLALQGAHRSRKSASSAEETLLTNHGLSKRSKLAEFDIIMDPLQSIESQSAIGQFLDAESTSDDRQDSLEGAVAKSRSKRKAVRHTVYHWPRAEVPYELHSSVLRISPLAKLKIRKAMDHWEKHTCIRFVPYIRRKHRNYVQIKEGEWCASKLGMTGGIQPLYLAQSCLKTGTIIHELGHTLGWVHEQARPDRDSHVRVRWDLIPAAYRRQYKKHDVDFINTYGVPYDYSSIMHYPSYGEILTKNSKDQWKIGQRERLSFFDVKLANIMYKCAARNRCDTTVKCEGYGYIGPSCKCVCEDGTQSCAQRKARDDPGTPPLVTRFPQSRFTYRRIEPSTTATLTRTELPCTRWEVVENSYIPRHNNDIAYGVTAEECQERCLTRTRFRCRSFDYWKARQQCYLSSDTHKRLRIPLSRDTRMVHYIRRQCHAKRPLPTQPSTPATSPTPTPHGRTTVDVTPVGPRHRPRQSPTTTTKVPLTTTSTTTSTTTTTTTTRAPVVGRRCPLIATQIGQDCVRDISFPKRPYKLSGMECENRLGQNLWKMDSSEILSSAMPSLISEGQEYWVNIVGYKSKNWLSAYFDFCPFLVKQSGKVIVKDTMCYHEKGFLCS